MGKTNDNRSSQEYDRMYSIEDIMTALMEFNSETYDMKVRPLIKSTEMQRNFYTSLFQILADKDDFRTYFVKHKGSIDYIRLTKSGIISEIWAEGYGGLTL